LPPATPPTPLNQHQHHRARPTKWRFLAYTLLALFVLLANALFTIIASVKYGLDSGIGTFYLGSCEYAKNTGVWIHLAINILGTLLLTASGFAMQYLCAPTREEVDRAHGRGGWLDIGVPSFRNLRRLGGRGRVLLWWCLAVSSVPLHLLWVPPSVDYPDSLLYGSS
jgi:hypothetical protein